MNLAKTEHEFWLIMSSVMMRDVIDVNQRISCWFDIRGKVASYLPPQVNALFDFKSARSCEGWKLEDNVAFVIEHHIDVEIAHY
jgi:hypothetical protein